MPADHHVAELDLLGVVEPADIERVVEPEHVDGVGIVGGELDAAEAGGIEDVGVEVVGAGVGPGIERNRTPEIAERLVGRGRIVRHRPGNGAAAMVAQGRLGVRVDVTAVHHPRPHALGRVARARHPRDQPHVGQSGELRRRSHDLLAVHIHRAGRARQRIGHGPVHLDARVRRGLLGFERAGERGLRQEGRGLVRVPPRQVAEADQRRRKAGARRLRLARDDQRRDIDRDDEKA